MDENTPNNAITSKLRPFLIIVIVFVIMALTVGNAYQFLSFNRKVATLSTELLLKESELKNLDIKLQLANFNGGLLVSKTDEPFDKKLFSIYSPSFDGKQVTKNVYRNWKDEQFEERIMKLHTNLGNDLVISSIYPAGSPFREGHISPNIKVYGQEVYNSWPLTTNTVKYETKENDPFTFEKYVYFDKPNLIYSKIYNCNKTSSCQVTIETEVESLKTLDYGGGIGYSAFFPIKETLSARTIIDDLVNTFQYPNVHASTGKEWEQ